MILMYHNVVDDDAPMAHSFQSITLRKSQFTTQMKVVKALFTIISLHDYIEYYQKNGHSKLNTIAISFDDCTQQTFETTMAIASQFKIPFTYFVSTIQLNNGPIIWGSYINALAYEMVYDEIELNEKKYKLKSYAQRVHFQTEFMQSAIASAYPENYVRNIEKKYPIPYKVKRFYLGMTSQQLAEAGQNNLVEIAAHTVSHPFLSRLNESMQQNEIEQCKIDLEIKTGERVRYFAYPSGDYNETTISLLMKANYQAAFAVKSKGLLGKSVWEYERVGIYSPSIIKLIAKLILKSI